MATKLSERVLAQRERPAQAPCHVIDPSGVVVLIAPRAVISAAQANAVRAWREGR